MQFDQPLAGEVAARRSLLESIPFYTGYGVEIAMLIEVWDRIGLEGMAQVGLGTKRNAHQSLADLGGMAGEVIEALSSTLADLNRPDLGQVTSADGISRDLVVRPAFEMVRPAGPADG